MNRIAIAIALACAGVCHAQTPHKRKHPPTATYWIAPPEIAKLHLVSLYDAGGRVLVTFSMDEAGNVSGSVLAPTVRLDDIIQRMWEESQDSRMAKLKRVSRKP